MNSLWIDIFVRFGTATIGTLLGACLAFLFGRRLQEKNFLVSNKEASIDRLVTHINELLKTCELYWSSENKSAKHHSSEIKIKQTQLSELLDFANKKYKFAHSGVTELDEFYREVSGDNFETASHAPSNEKLVAINKRANSLVITLLKNKI